MVAWGVAAFASALAIQPGHAETFHCGKDFVTFQGEEGGHVGVITVRKEAIAYVLTSQTAGFSGLKVRQPDGEMTVINIDEDTHSQLIECLD